MCKLELECCKSPVTFHCTMTDTKRADLTMFLSTQCREPNKDNYMRKVERLKKFKFYQETKRIHFKDDEVLYLNIESQIGCTITIRATKPGDSEPSSDDGDQKVIKQRNLVPQNLNFQTIQKIEDKLDALEKQARRKEEAERRQKTTNCIDYLEQNKVLSGNYLKFTEEKRKWQFDRRQVLQNFAGVNKEANSEFAAKLRYFQLHKWEILKAVKETELDRKIKRNARRKLLRNWVIMRALHYHMLRSY